MRKIPQDYSCPQQRLLHSASPGAISQGERASLLQESTWEVTAVPRMDSSREGARLASPRLVHPE